MCRHPTPAADEVAAARRRLRHLRQPTCTSPRIRCPSASARASCSATNSPARSSRSASDVTDLKHRRPRRGRADARLRPLREPAGEGSPAWCAEMTPDRRRLCRICRRRRAAVPAPARRPSARGRRAGRAGLGRACTAVVRSGMKPGDQVADPRRGADRPARRVLGAADGGARGHRRRSHPPSGERARPRSARPASRYPGPGSMPNLQSMLGGAPDIVFECVGKQRTDRLRLPPGAAARHGRRRRPLHRRRRMGSRSRRSPRRSRSLFAVFFTMARVRRGASMRSVRGRFRPQALITGPNRASARCPRRSRRFDGARRNARF